MNRLNIKPELTNNKKICNIRRPSITASDLRLVSRALCVCVRPSWLIALHLDFAEDVALKHSAGPVVAGSILGSKIQLVHVVDFGIVAQHVDLDWSYHDVDGFVMQSYGPHLDGVLYMHCGSLNPQTPYWNSPLIVVP
jgi:hypothetical protein